MSRARHACVIGWPIGHSRSPLIHGYWLERYGIEGTYTRLAVPPAELTAFFDGLRARGLAGCNVTVPHKEPVFHLADHVTEEARCVGAANTLWLEGDRLHATNTDTYGFLSQLDAAAPGWSVAGVPVVLLGAGGAARAVLHGLLQRGCREVRVVNRTLAKAEALRTAFGASAVTVDWTDRDRALAGARLLVNTTTLGMAGAATLDLGLDRLPLEAIVADIVYVPVATPLLERARRRGNPTVDGLGMLLHQAVPGFEKWFGRRPEVTPELRALLAADIEAP